MKRLNRADAWKRKTQLTYDNTFNDMHTVGVLLSTTADHYSKRGLEVNGKIYLTNPIIYNIYPMRIPFPQPII